MDFALCLQLSVSQLVVLNEIIDTQVIAKYLQVVPFKFTEIALVDLSTLTIECDRVAQGSGEPSGGGGAEGSK
jgi:uncharacterized membrane protein YjfL (UPF0719 family)